MALSAVRRFWRYMSDKTSDLTPTDHKCPHYVHSVNNSDYNPDAMIELDVLKRKMGRLVTKLERHGIHLETFDKGDIDYGEELGRGGEGIVHQCTVMYQGLPIEAAAKRVLTNTVEGISFTLDEIELLCLAQHHIINTTLHVYGVAAVPDPGDPGMGQLVIITEVGKMNVLQLYQEECVPLHVTMDLWARLAAAVHTIHKKNIIHRDLKPENILVMEISREDTGQMQKIDFRIIDFGMGRRVFTDKITRDDIVGTNGYHAPEILQEEPYDCKADIFMLGVTFSVMLQSPYFLKSASFKEMLYRLHDLKKEHVYGRQMYEAAIEPDLCHYYCDTTALAPIKDMISDMLEDQHHRNITLLQVVRRCRREANAARKQVNLFRQPPCSTASHDSGIGSDKGDNDVSGEKSDKENRVKAVERVKHVRLNEACKKMENICKFTKRLTRNGLILKKARLQKAENRLLLKRVGALKAREETGDMKHYLRQRINVNNSTNMLNIGAQGIKSSPKDATPKSPIEKTPNAKKRIMSPKRKSAKSLSPVRRAVKVRSPRRKSVVNLRSNDNKTPTVNKTPTMNAPVRALRPRATPELKDITLSQCNKRRCYMAFLEDTLDMTMAKRPCRHTIG